MRPLTLALLAVVLIALAPAVRVSGAEAEDCDPLDYLWSNWGNLPGWVREHWLTHVCQPAYILEIKRVNFRGYPATLVIFGNWSESDPDVLDIYAAMFGRGPWSGDRKLYGYKLGKLGMYTPPEWHKTWTIPVEQMAEPESQPALTVKITTDVDPRPYHAKQ